MKWSDKALLLELTRTSMLLSVTSQKLMQLLLMLNNAGISKYQGPSSASDAEDASRIGY